MRPVAVRAAARWRASSDAQYSAVPGQRVALDARGKGKSGEEWSGAGKRGYGGDRGEGKGGEEWSGAGKRGVVEAGVR